MLVHPFPKNLSKQQQSPMLYIHFHTYMKSSILTSWPFLAVLIALLIPAIVQGQTDDPYHLSLRREAPYLLGSTFLLIKGEQLREDLNPVSIESVRARDLFDPAIDEIPFIYGRHRAERFSDYTMYVSAGLATSLLAGRPTRQDFGKITLLFAETMLVNQGLTNFTKSVFQRPRPYVLNPEWAPDRPVYSGDRSSMISGHTSGSAAGSFFFARVFADYYPDSKLKPYVWAAAAALPAMTGFLRVRAAKHYPSDVIAGYALGATVGYLIPTLHKKPLMKGRLTLAPTGGGIYAAYSLR